MRFNETQSHAALRRLMASRGITEAEISAAVDEEIRSIEARLAYLRGDSVFMRGEPVTKVNASVNLIYGPTATKRKRAKVSPQQAESRRIQGVFLSLIRRIPKSRRAVYSAMAKEAGREVAIAAMRTL